MRRRGLWLCIMLQILEHVSYLEALWFSTLSGKLIALVSSWILFLLCTYFWFVRVCLLVDLIMPQAVNFSNMNRFMEYHAYMCLPFCIYMEILWSDIMPFFVLIIAMVYTTWMLMIWNYAWLNHERSRKWHALGSKFTAHLPLCWPSYLRIFFDYTFLVKMQILFLTIGWLNYQLSYTTLHY